MPRRSADASKDEPAASRQRIMKKPAMASNAPPSTPKPVAAAAGTRKVGNAAGLLLTGSLKKGAKFWNMEGDECCLTLQHDDDEEVSAALFMPDGNSIVTASKAGVARLWSLGDGQCVRTLFEQKEGIRYMSLSADGRYAFVTGEFHGSGRSIWDLASGECKINFSGGATLGAMSQDARLIVMRSYERGGHELTVGELKLEGKLGRDFGVLPAFDGSAPLAAAFAPDNRMVVVAMASEPFAFNIGADGELTFAFVLRGHKTEQWCCCFSYDGRYALTGSNDKTAKLWDVTRGAAGVEKIYDGTEYPFIRPLLTFEGHNDNVLAVAFSRDDRHVITGSKDGRTRVFNAQNARCLQVFCPRAGAPKSIHFAPSNVSVTAEQLRRLDQQLATAKKAAKKAAAKKIVAADPQPHSAEVQAVAEVGGA